jgi:serine/threonine-protein kinase RsbW
MNKRANEIDISISSYLDNLDLVQIITDRLTDFMQFDEDSAHWIGMSVRESVTNAIQHGNKLDADKKVDICFKVFPDRITISVKDQGSGFHLDDIPNPLDAENLLKPSGRGIFYIRTFMDEVEFRNPAEGGTEVFMIKKLSVKTRESEHEDRNTHRR